MLDLKKKVTIWVCKVKTSAKVIWRAGGREFTHNWELLIIQVKDKYILHMPTSRRQFVFINLSETDFPDKNKDSTQTPLYLKGKSYTVVSENFDFDQWVPETPSF